MVRIAVPKVETEWGEVAATTVSSSSIAALGPATQKDFRPSKK